MPKKPKTNQPQIPNESQGRDFFQTPNYAVDLLVPLIPKNVKWIWEPACGDGKIVNRLKMFGYGVYASDIRKSTELEKSYVRNFLLDERPLSHYFAKHDEAIITNPPFSLKYKFIDKALEYNVPFAFLIPFDMCQQLIKLFDLGCQGLVPTRRIDYLTPNGKQGKDSSSQFHSFWLTWKFNLPKQLTIVELSLKEKKENI